MLASKACGTVAYLGIMKGLYKDNGKENGNYRGDRDYIGLQYIGVLWVELVILRRVQGLRV